MFGIGDGHLDERVFRVTLGEREGGTQPVLKEHGPINLGSAFEITGSTAQGDGERGDQRDPSCRAGDQPPVDAGADQAIGEDADERAGERDRHGRARYAQQVPGEAPARGVAREFSRPGDAIGDLRASCGVGLVHGLVSVKGASPLEGSRNLHPDHTNAGRQGLHKLLRS